LSVRRDVFNFDILARAAVRIAEIIARKGDKSQREDESENPAHAVTNSLDRANGQALSSWGLL
jgi:hypothetical protein